MPPTASIGCFVYFAVKLIATGHTCCVHTYDFSMPRKHRKQLGLKTTFRIFDVSSWVEKTKFQMVSHDPIFWMAERSTGTPGCRQKCIGKWQNPLQIYLFGKRLKWNFPSREGIRAPGQRKNAQRWKTWKRAFVPRCLLWKSGHSTGHGWRCKSHTPSVLLASMRGISVVIRSHLEEHRMSLVNVQPDPGTSTTKQLILFTPWMALQMEEARNVNASLSSGYLWRSVAELSGSGQEWPYRCSRWAANVQRSLSWLAGVVWTYMSWRVSMKHWSTHFLQEISHESQ